MAKDLEKRGQRILVDTGQGDTVYRVCPEATALRDLMGELHPENWVCKWPDGTYCWLADLDEYLTFMGDDFEVIAVADYELQPLRLM